MRAHPPTTQVTWTVDVAAIVQSRCATCHRAGGFAPVPIETYEQAKASAKAIRAEVLSGRMPPWPAARGYGDFTNDGSLTPIEMDLLARWVAGGAPLGPAVAARAVPSSDGPPSSSLRVELPEATIEGGGVERREVATGLDADRWIVGWEFTPGDASLVEAATLRVDPGGIFGSWTPFDGAVKFPRGVAARLPRGGTVAVDIRYRKSTEPRADRSIVTLHFGARGRDVRVREFPCGAESLDTDVDVLAVTPSSERAGSAIEVVARRIDGSIEPLCVVRNYLPGYPVTYRLRRPLRLRRGDEIRVTASSERCGAALESVASSPRRSER